MQFLFCLISSIGFGLTEKGHLSNELKFTQARFQTDTYLLPPSANQKKAEELPANQRPRVKTISMKTHYR